ncbi:hypothetical protein [Nonomuraea sp. NPDC005692]|uniref:hypothetical protein n=1 Tax=Nonomuraea sp. NPDC005692 TaxID=3157168 RepID=UPI0033C13624
MVRKFTRRFDAQAPRNPDAELYDTHVPKSDSWGTAYTVPGARPRSAFHLSLECEALWRTLELVESLGQELDLVPIGLAHARQTLTACPMCARRHDGHFEYRLCDVRLGSKWLPTGVVLEWRQGTDGDWHGVVVIRRGSGSGSYAVTKPRVDLQERTTSSAS